MSTKTKSRITIVAIFFVLLSLQSAEAAVKCKAGFIPYMNIDGTIAMCNKIIKKLSNGFCHVKIYDPNQKYWKYTVAEMSCDPAKWGFVSPDMDGNFFRLAPVYSTNISLSSIEPPNPVIPQVVIDKYNEFRALRDGATVSSSATAK